MNTELIEVLQDLIEAADDANQMAGLDWSQNEQAIVNRARALIDRAM